MQRRSIAALRLLTPLVMLTAAAFAQVPVALPLAAPTPLLAASSPAAFAQISAVMPPIFPVAATEDSSADSTDLPEDPSASLAPDQGSQNNGTPAGATSAARVVPYYIKYIYPGQVAQPRLTTRDKFILDLHDRGEPLNIASMVIAAGYEQVTNDSPNYGVDKGAYGERLGAAAIRQTAQGFFSDAVFASALHEDPRYYVEGDQYGLVHRTLYAITRPLVTRTDNGRSTINGSLLLGYAAAAALNNAYYPPINRNFKDTAESYGGSIGGAALGFFVYEFSEDALEVLHIKKKP